MAPTPNHYQLSHVKSKVLLVSTDPAHNLSDAFNQKFGAGESPVDGFDNLYAMEVDLAGLAKEIQSRAVESLPGGASENPLQQLVKGMMGGGDADGGGGLMGGMPGIMDSMPGMGEALGFQALLTQLEASDYDTVVFDTAPTGHTLQLLAFPEAMQSSMDRLTQSLGGPLKAMLGSMLGSEAGDDVFSRRKEAAEGVIKRLRDPEHTTFVAVAIPEFLSLYETERLVQELARSGTDCHNIVVNQIVMKHPDAPPCGLCSARQNMQGKYLSQIEALYADDFHVTRMPLLHAEVRGPAALRKFAQFLLLPYDPVEDGEATLSG